MIGTQLVNQPKVVHNHHLIRRPMQHHHCAPMIPIHHPVSGLLFINLVEIIARIVEILLNSKDKEYRALIVSV